MSALETDPALQPREAVAGKDFNHHHYALLLIFIITITMIKISEFAGPREGEGLCAVQDQHLLEAKVITIVL